MPGTATNPPALTRRNVHTVRHHNARPFLDVADDLDAVLSHFGLTRVLNPGSASWKFPAHHPKAGVAAAELTCETGGRQSFGVNEESVFQNPQAVACGLFRTAFRVIPVRPGTASFLDVRLVQDTTQRRQTLEKLLCLMGLAKNGVDDESFAAAVQAL